MFVTFLIFHSKLFDIILVANFACFIFHQIFYQIKLIQPDLLNSLTVIYIKSSGSFFQSHHFWY